MRVAAVGAGAVGDDCRIELLAKLAAELGNPSLGIFGKLLRRGAVLDGIYRLARMIFEVFEYALQLSLHVFELGLLLFSAFGGKMLLFASDVFFSCLELTPFGFQVAKLVMQAVQKVTHVARLRAQARARSLDDG